MRAEMAFAIRRVTLLSAVDAAAGLAAARRPSPTKMLPSMLTMAAWRSSMRAWRTLSA